MRALLAMIYDSQLQLVLTQFGPLYACPYDFDSSRFETLLLLSRLTDSQEQHRRLSSAQTRAQQRQRRAGWEPLAGDRLQSWGAASGFDAAAAAAAAAAAPLEWSAARCTSPPQKQAAAEGCSWPTVAASWTGAGGAAQSPWAEAVASRAGVAPRGWLVAALAAGAAHWPLVGAAAGTRAAPRLQWPRQSTWRPPWPPSCLLAGWMPPFSPFAAAARRPPPGCRVGETFAW